MRKTLESENFARAQRIVAEEVPKLIADAAGRRRLGAEIVPSELEGVRDVGNFFEVMGVFVKLGIIDRTLVCDLWDGVVFRAWKQLEPVVMIRRKVRYSGVWSSFEYLAVLCEQSLSRHEGYYPRGIPRMTIDKRSMEAAAAFTQDQAGSSESVP